MHIGDKFIAVKKMGFIDEGITVEVTDIKEGGIIWFEVIKNNENSNNNNTYTSCYGTVDIATFEEHFERLEPKAKVTCEESYEVTEEHVKEIMSNSEFKIYTTFGRSKTIICRLPNGYVITESVDCENPKDYDKNMVNKSCYDKIESKIWELETYRLQHLKWEDEYSCGDCENCPCDGEGCEDEIEVDVDEVDCDNCDDYSCLNNPKHYS